MIGKKLLFALLILIALISPLFIVEHMLSSVRTFGGVTVGSNIDPLKKHIVTMELFPFTGFHMQANQHHQGEMPWESQTYKDYDVKTGDMGFFVDFSFNSPPVKKENEFRIILIGGSGAQGWGGRTNEDMLYRQLEKMLNDEFKGEKIVFRVINMAMASSITYQNFIALNKFAHGLQPDLILSYSGRNDIVIPYWHTARHDGYYKFDDLNAVVYSTRPYEHSPKLRLFTKLFPNLIAKTKLGSFIRAAYSEYFLDTARQNYIKSRGIESIVKSDRAFFDLIVLAQYVDALKSIKRDFCGIPVMVVWQINDEDFNAIINKAVPDAYNVMYDEAVERLSPDPSKNSGWFFLNAHRRFEKDMKTNKGLGTHLSNEGHRIVSEFIAKELSKKLRDGSIPKRFSPGC